MNEEIRNILLDWSKKEMERRLNVIDIAHEKYLLCVGRDEEEETE